MISSTGAAFSFVHASEIEEKLYVVFSSVDSLSPNKLIENIRFNINVGVPTGRNHRLNCYMWQLYWVLE